MQGVFSYKHDRSFAISETFEEIQQPLEDATQYTVTVNNLATDGVDDASGNTVPGVLYSIEFATA